MHIPFCLHKCHYCDFNSHERLQPDWDAYRNALITELKHWSNTPQFSGRTLYSIFFGGGTPSLAPPSLIETVIDAARDCCGIENDAEITLEANPGTADSGNFRAYRQAGVNRLSIGIQSLDTTELRWLERIHGSDEAIQAYHIARDAGFSNINLDLMYGLPGQNLQDWLTTLHTAIELSPEHLSCYQLTVEPHTRLAATHAQNPYV
ncbi:MAG: radical SAM family heme chaperone HemW, partial [Mariprofundus sp.]|nr:radical SAM family heme chaperone HemW [Mariprofundus sp.]